MRFSSAVMNSCFVRQPSQYLPMPEVHVSRVSVLRFFVAASDRGKWHKKPPDEEKGHTLKKENQELKCTDSGVGWPKSVHKLCSQNTSLLLL